MIPGIDASMDCSPYVSDLQALGVSFVARYYTNLERTRRPAKVLTSREAHLLSEAGFDLVTVWELLATPTYFNPSQGEADGKYGYGYATEIIKQPEGSAIYFAIDFDATEEQYRSAVLPYMEGVNRAFGSISGGYTIVRGGCLWVGSSLRGAKIGGGVSVHLVGAIERLAWIAHVSRLGPPAGPGRFSPSFSI